MHAAKVLGVEVFAVEAVACGEATFSTIIFTERLAATIVLRRGAMAAGPGVAAPDFETEMLHPYVACPFVLGAEGLAAAVAAEDAAEGTGVTGLDVLAECGCRGEFAVALVAVRVAGKNIGSRGTAGR